VEVGGDQANGGHFAKELIRRALCRRIASATENVADRGTEIGAEKLYIEHLQEGRQ
jgi:hypothetical protein